MQQQEASGSQFAPEAASPVRSAPLGNFDESEAAVGGNFVEEEAIAAAGEEAERGASLGNRWPREETVALLRIRSEMDAAFRDATLKGPLWDEVSRKLAELGYKRNAKKCKEKFENVQKYYKRTKEGRAARQDGKSYRFFNELEALHASAGSTSTVGTKLAPIAASTVVSPLPISFSTAAMAGPSAGVTIQASPISVFGAQQIRPVTELVPPVTTAAAVTTTSGVQNLSAAAGISFSSNSSSSDSMESEDDEGTEDAPEASQRRKRPHGDGQSHGGSRKKMMAFFEGLMKQVIDRQEAMQRQFLETIEKREQDRMIREEAWRRQEMAWLGREQEQLAQQRAASASRDAALISYLQKLSGDPGIPIPAMQAAAIPAVVTTTAAAPPPPPPQPPSQPTKQLSSTIAAAVQPLQQQPPPPPPQSNSQQIGAIQPQQNVGHDSEQQHQQQASSSLEMVAMSEAQEGTGASGGFEGTASNRWPKAEIHALIQLRSGLESRYQEAGPKGPLWEEIAAGMQRLGYNRNPKRCKEKWENINKYYKKVKESNKKRPEDAKTCPYFHQLDALYRHKQLAGTGGGSTSPGAVVIQRQQEMSMSFRAPERVEPISVKPPPPPQTAPTEGPSKNGSEGSSNGGKTQVPTSNGGLTPSFFEQGMKKPEDIMKELMKQTHQQAMDSYDNEGDSDTMEQDDEDDEDDDEDDESGKLQYKIQFQRQHVGGNGGSGGGNPSSTTNSGSFLAIAQ